MDYLLGFSFRLRRDLLVIVGDGRWYPAVHREVFECPLNFAQTKEYQRVLQSADNVIVPYLRNSCQGRMNWVASMGDEGWMLIEDHCRSFDSPAPPSHLTILHHHASHMVRNIVNRARPYHVPCGQAHTFRDNYLCHRYCDTGPLPAKFRESCTQAHLIHSHFHQGWTTAYLSVGNARGSNSRYRATKGQKREASGF